MMRLIECGWLHCGRKSRVLGKDIWEMRDQGDMESKQVKYNKISNSPWYFQIAT